MKRIKNPYIWIPALFIIVALSLPLWVYLVTTQYWGFINLNGKNEIGDALGGTTAPFIGIVTAFLTFIAFWVQYKFNQSQMVYLKLQTVETKLTALNHTLDLVTREKISLNHIQLSIIEDFSMQLRDKLYFNKGFNNFTEFESFVHNDFKINSKKMTTYSPLTYSDFFDNYYQILNIIKFIYSLHVTHLNNSMFEENRMEIFSDYISKVCFSIRIQQHKIFYIMLKTYFLLNGVDIENLLSDKYPETGYIKMHKLYETDPLLAL